MMTLAIENIHCCPYPQADSASLAACQASPSVPQVQVATLQGDTLLKMLKAFIDLLVQFGLADSTTLENANEMVASYAQARDTIQLQSIEKAAAEQLLKEQNDKINLITKILGYVASAIMLLNPIEGIPMMVVGACGLGVSAGLSETQAIPKLVERVCQGISDPNLRTAISLGIDLGVSISISAGSAAALTAIYRGLGAKLSSTLFKAVARIGCQQGAQVLLSTPFLQDALKIMLGTMEGEQYKQLRLILEVLIGACLTILMTFGSMYLARGQGIELSKEIDQLPARIEKIMNSAMIQAGSKGVEKVFGNANIILSIELIVATAQTICRAISLAWTKEQTDRRFEQGVLKGALTKIESHIELTGRQRKRLASQSSDLEAYCSQEMDRWSELYQSDIVAARAIMRG